MAQILRGPEKEEVLKDEELRSSQASSTKENLKIITLNPKPHIMVIFSIQKTASKSSHKHPKSPIWTVDVAYRYHNSNRKLNRTATIVVLTITSNRSSQQSWAGPPGLAVRAPWVGACDLVDLLAGSPPETGHLCNSSCWQNDSEDNGRTW